MRKLKSFSEWKKRLKKTKAFIRREGSVLFIWGANDKTFPAALGRKMADTLPTCEGLIALEDACFLVHEEQADSVAAHSIAFLQGEKTSNFD